MEEYRITPETIAEHLSSVVKFPTISYTDPDKMDFSIFAGMQASLEASYPLLHQTLKKEVVGKGGLLYTWKGTKNTKKGLLFMAHQDVVPEGDHALWFHEPYSGDIEDGHLVWGRGSGDCKSNIIAQMEAIEHLISVGFEPEYDIYLAYGYNEEVGSGLGDKSSAAQISALLESRGVQVEGVFDEGGGIRPMEIDGEKLLSANFSLAEKGYADFIISRKDPGGHSMKPHKEGAFWYIAKAILAIEDNPFPYRPTTILKQKYAAIAPYCKDENRKRIFSDIEANWDEMLKLIEEDDTLPPYFHTTMAITMAQGSEKANILPQKASILVNCRLLAGDTLESVQQYIESILPEGMEVTLDHGNNPSPESEFHCDLQELVLDIMRDVYDNKDIFAVPDVTTGGTDAKNMYNLTNHVYRMAMMYRRNMPANAGAAHAANEVMDTITMADAAKVYVELLKRYQEV